MQIPWKVLLVACCAVCRGAIQLPAGAPEPVRWGAGELRSALAQKQISENQADVRVTFTEQPAPADEAFTLEKSAAGFTIRGGGPVGAMYGLLELAERVRAATGNRWADLAASIQPTEQKPDLAIRADNVFIHVKPLLINNLEMWREYLDMLARSRFNMLDMHGGFDLDSTGFPNLFPLLVTVPGYPNAGDPRAQARNLADFSAIVEYAKSRGIKVALMNYSAAVPAPAGSPAGTPPIVPANQLADYTAKATAELIRRVPDLYEIGFRIGETGQPARFFQDAYLKGFADAHASNLRLYTRSWLTTKEQLEPIAQASTSGFDIEIKYNGEHLGLPYQAMQRLYGTYSYEHYLDIPAKYKILWQVRANGTHRYWAWENTDFIRRTVGTFQLGNARGFTLEPPIAYFPVDAATYYRSPEDQKVYKYIWQKDWMWYFAWGRLGYNAALPEATVRQAFVEHYGPAGGAIYTAMQASSKIVPLVFAYRFVGPDHRDYSPETETGYLDNAGSIIGARRPVPEGLLQYAKNTPEDDRSFAGIDEWVNHRIDAVADGRLGPFAVAETLQDAAETAQKAIASVSGLDGRRADEWRLLKTDLLSAAWLGRYHAARIEGLTYFEHAWLINDNAEYQKSTQLLSQSRDAWKALAETADTAYSPVNNPLRHQKQFEWKSQSALLEKTDAQAAAIWATRPRGGAREPSGARAPAIQLRPTDHAGNEGLGVERLDFAIAGNKKSVMLTAKPSSAKPLSRVVLWWKPLPSSDFWRSQDMVEGSAGTYATTVPFTSEGLMYLVELQDTAGGARNFPLALQETPYRVIPPQAQ